MLPLWFTAGAADWCHRRTDIEHTAGTRESVIHWLMLAEAATPIALGLYCQPNAEQHIYGFLEAVPYKGMGLAGSGNRLICIP